MKSFDHPTFDKATTLDDATTLENATTFDKVTIDRWDRERDFFIDNLLVRIH